MNNLKATEMIDRQRRLWRSQDSDLAIARRAERTYLSLAASYICLGSSLTLTQHTQFGRIAILAGFFVGAVLFFIHSRRFAQIQKLLVDSNANSDAH